MAIPSLAKLCFENLKANPKTAGTMSLDLSNHSHVTPKFLSQLPVLFPKLVYLSLENCKGVSQTDVFKDYALLKTLNAKGTQISETAARRLSMSVQHLEVCLKGVSFVSWFSQGA